MSDPRQQMRQLLYGFFTAQSLYVAARLALGDELATGPRSSTALAEAIGADEPSLRRLLRALTALDVVTEPDPGVFELTDLGEFLRSDVPGSISRHAQLLCGPENWLAWGDLEHSIRTGEPAWDHVHGQSSFSYLAANPVKQAEFNAAMAEGSKALAPAIIAAADLGDARSLVDVGGGSGTLLAGLVTAHPELHGTVFDTEEGLTHAAETLRRLGVAERCETVAGDFFTAVPENADAYLLKSILHDWDDELSIQILTVCRKAMHSDSILLLAEPVMPAEISPEKSVLPLMMSDLNMMVFAGGRERTEAEFRALLEPAGFALESITPCPGPAIFSILRARPV
jgi:hypothetical protein